MKTMAAFFVEHVAGVDEFPGPPRVELDELTGT